MHARSARRTQLNAATCSVNDLKRQAKQPTQPLAAAFIQVTAAVHTTQKFHCVCMILLALAAHCQTSLRLVVTTRCQDARHTCCICCWRQQDCAPAEDTALARFSRGNRIEYLGSVGNLDHHPPPPAQKQCRRSVQHHCQLNQGSQRRRWRYLLVSPARETSASARIYRRFPRNSSPSETPNSEYFWKCGRFSRTRQTRAPDLSQLPLVPAASAMTRPCGDYEPWAMCRVVERTPECRGELRTRAFIAPP